MKPFRICFLISTAIFAVCCSSNEVDYSRYVDVKIGSGGHGHVFVGASVPFGMIQAGPSSISEEWDLCSGYHASDSTVIGFSQTHVSGTGDGDMDDVLLIPVTGKDLTYARGDYDSQESGLWSYADRTTEIARPEYYSVELMRYPVKVEMTATARVGLTRFTFEKGAKDAAIVVDLENGRRDSTTVANIEIIDNTHIKGCRFSTGWCKDHKQFFVAEFSKPFTACTEHGKSGYIYRFDFDDPQTVLVKVALSPNSEEKAQANMEAELPGWDFEQVCDDAVAAWNKELSKIRITTNNEDYKTIFYTAMYHSMIAPSIFSDTGDPVRYTTLSLWDTYRAMMPLYSIMHPEKEADMMNTFLDIYDKEGKLPVWHLMGNETWAMNGNPGVSVVADAITKDLEGFDIEKAYESLKVSCMKTDRGQGMRMERGYIPADLMNKSVAYDLEYAIADAAVAEVAKKLGHKEDYEYFLDRSRWWRRHYDPETGFVRGIKADGTYTTPFNPFSSNHYKTDYCEGNAWQYTWLAPQDIEGLVNCHGSVEETVKALDMLFAASSELQGNQISADMTGLIGQYVHGNEPSHHVVYLYTMLGYPDKTADLVRQICTTMYTSKIDGICGNEDCGQMSAWYILSTMGFFQTEPAGGRFYFGSPLYDEMEISLPDGKSFKIIAHNNSEENKYIGSIVLNGKPYDMPYINYADIMAGGTLEYNMIGSR